MPWIKTCLMWVACGTMTTLLAGESIELTPNNEPSVVFGGSETTFTYAITQKGRLEGRLAWLHSAGRRTIARGEVPVTDAGEIAIHLKIPPVRDMIAFETTLTVALQPRAGGKAVASHSRRLWILPHDPFTGRRQWLESLDITLFDPQGDTRDAFESLEFPFREVRRAAALEQVDRGIVIVGEGFSWRDFPGLGDVLPSLAAKGVSVLCLAPADGSFVVPGTREAETAAPDSVAFRRESIITKLDKRLDSAAWTGRGELVAGRMAIAGDGGLVTAAVSGDRTGWPWLEFAYSSKAKWIVCGFGVIRHWDDSPNARYFLTALLEEVSQSRGDKK